MTRIAVIGGGLSGLVFAHLLQDSAEIQVFEKSRGYGGRMATRRHDEMRFDHGAQFFTARSKSFKAFLEPFIEAGVVARWDARFVEIDGSRISARRSWSGDPAHYVGQPGMNALGAALGETLEVHLGTRVGDIAGAAGKWQLRDSNAQDLGQFDWVVSSMPSPQARSLLPSEFAHLEAVGGCSMPGCYSLMLGFSSALALDWDAALVRDAAISWVSVNSSKPGRGSATCLLVQASNQWAEANMERADDAVIADLVAELGRVIGPVASDADHVALHRWRYANPGLRQGEASLIDADRQLAAIGDWCIRGRVEAAYLSGLDAAQRVRRLL